MPALTTTTPLRPRFAACSAHARAVDEPGLSSSLRGGFSPTDVAQSLQTPAGEALAQARRTSEGSAPIAVIGGGVSGVFAALALRSLGYGNITVIESAQRLGGKAGSFDHGGFSFPIGAVSTPFALREASFTGAQILEKPLRFATSAFAHSRTKLQILDANNLLPRRLQGGTPRRFHASELSHGATESWKEAFSGTGPPHRFYPHHVDFASKPELASAARPRVLGEEAWGRADSSWPLIYVSAHGYGVARAADAPPNYYWQRFAQKSTNAAKLPSLGPRGPALRGFDTTRHLERLLEQSGVAVLRSTRVASVLRSTGGVAITTAAGGAPLAFDKLVVATDLKAARSFLDTSAEEADLFSRVRHLNYHTLASHIEIPWVKPASVYYLGGHQGERDAVDAGAATGGCPTILFRPYAASNLTITWAYGGASLAPGTMEACLRRTVSSLGGRFGGVLLQQEWPDYFPHLAGSDLASQVPRRLDALQGRKRTYYVGEIFNLPLVSECVDWARYLIKRHFRDVRPPPSARGASAPTIMRRQLKVASLRRGRGRWREGAAASGGAARKPAGAGGARRRYSATELMRQQLEALVS